MNEFKDKIKDLKKNLESLDKSKKNSNITKKGSGASFGFKISTEIVAALIVGVGIGIFVDNYFGTRPFGLIIFFILGAFAGFLNVYRVIRRIEKNK